MGPATVPILQIVCLVLVAIAIVNVKKAQRNLDKVTKNMERKFNEIDDAITSLQGRKREWNRDGR